MLSDLIRDLRYALRMLAAAPTFTAVVVMTLALGVGANALIFTAVDAILLRSPGLADPGSLVSVYNAGTDGQTGQSLFSTVSFPDFADVRESGIFQDAAAYGGISVSLDSGAETESIAGELVTGNYFQVLGVAPAYGRAFAAEEDRRGMPVHVAVVSYAFWQNRLGASPSAIGREINLNGSPYVVIGVAPPPLRGGEARSSTGRLAADGASTGSTSTLGRAAAFARQRRSARCARAALAQYRGQGQTGESATPSARQRSTFWRGVNSRPILKPTGNAPSTRLRSERDRACGPRRGRCSTCSRLPSHWCS